MGRGYNPYPNAYLYRDWVVKAFNDDLPYDQFVKAQLAADLLEPSHRVRALPALGFLGIGPWYYDNGSVEVTRADERHDRVDVVSRGFLGLTVACARCHDHKYDPIPQRDYYSLAGVFLNSQYHEYPLAPASVVDDYKALEKKKKDKERLLADFMDTESRQLAETLGAPVGRLHAGGLARHRRAEGGRRRRRRRQAPRLRAARPLDPLPREAAEVLSLPREVAGDDQGRRNRRTRPRSLADEFQELVVGRAVRGARDQRRERHHPRAGAPGHEEEGEGQPSQRVHHERRLLSGVRARAEEPGGRPRAARGRPLPLDLVDSADPANAKAADRPGLFVFRGPALDRWLGADRRRYIEALRADIKAIGKAMPPKYPYVHGVADLEKPAPIKSGAPGQPVQARRRGAAAFPVRPGGRSAAGVREGQRPPRTGRCDHHAADRHARDS